MLKKYFLILIITTLYISCNKEDSNSDIPGYVGFYKIVRFQVQNEVDLNNDNISSSDLQLELEKYFKNSSYDLEVLLRNEEPSNAIKIKFPDWNLDSGTSEKQDTPHEFYSSTLISYYTTINEIEFIPKKWGENEELIKGWFDQENKIIRLRLKKKYFNFDSNKWEKLEISAEYEKIN